MYRLTVSYKIDKPEPHVKEKPLASQENLMVGISQTKYLPPTLRKTTTQFFTTANLAEPA